MGMFPVSPEKEDELNRRMACLGVREEDLEEKFVRSGGHGGQNVNKVATCVMLMHGPTQLQVKCQTTRRQGMNRYLARLLLLSKLERVRREKEEAKRRKREKARRQKRGRSRVVKERILAGKRHQSEKKSLRKRVRVEE